MHKYSANTTLTLIAFECEGMAAGVAFKDPEQSTPWEILLVRAHSTSFSIWETTAKICKCFSWEYNMCSVMWFQNLFADQQSKCYPCSIALMQNAWLFFPTDQMFSFVWKWMIQLIEVIPNGCSSTVFCLLVQLYLTAIVKQPLEFIQAMGLEPNKPFSDVNHVYFTAHSIYNVYRSA